VKEVIATSRSGSAQVPAGAVLGRPMRVGLVGAGRAASFHLDAIAEVGGAQASVICSRSGTTAHALARSVPGCRGTSSLSNLWSGPDPVDAAVIAVDADQTLSVATELVGAGVPVLIEKPAAPSGPAARSLAALAAERGVVALVGVNRRYYSLVQQAMAVVTTRGPLTGVEVEGHEPSFRFLASGAIGLEQLDRWPHLNSLHYIDLLRMAGGPVEEVVALTGEVPRHQHFAMAASLRFASGALGHYVSHWNSGAPPMLRLFGDGVSCEVDLTHPGGGYAWFADGRRVKLTIDVLDQQAKPGVVAQDAAFLGSVLSGFPALWPASDLLDHADTLDLVERLIA
jgi:predicted dehydrogenase